jgi:hypothetical protein
MGFLVQRVGIKIGAVRPLDDTELGVHPNLGKQCGVAEWREDTIVPLME